MRTTENLLYVCEVHSLDCEKIGVPGWFMCMDVLFLWGALPLGFGETSLYFQKSDNYIIYIIFSNLEVWICFS